MKVLVTGASGFIGFHLVEELAKQGLSLRAAYRPGSQFHFESDFLIDGLDLETIPLDLTDRHAVYRALEGCQLLFHTDCLVSFRSRDKGRLYAYNQTGTQYILEAALHHSVEKVVYTSGIETLRAPAGKEEATEQDGVSLDELPSPFEKSRYLAEREVHRYLQKGLNIRIVHPTVCIGPRDSEPTLFTKYLLRYLQGKVRYFLDTGLNLVDVVDVAKGHLLAAKRGEAGERYILGNQNIYLLELFQGLQRITQIQPPKTALPHWMARQGIQLLAMIGKSPAIPNAVFRRLQQPLFFSSKKAREDLGMPQSNIWESLRREVQGFGPIQSSK